MSYALFSSVVKALGSCQVFTIPSLPKLEAEEVAQWAKCLGYKTESIFIMG